MRVDEGVWVAVGVAVHMHLAPLPSRSLSKGGEKKGGRLGPFPSIQPPTPSTPHPAQSIHHQGTLSVWWWVEGQS